MLASGGFKKTIVISFFLHAGIFTVFNFSFGPRTPVFTPPAVSFLGQCLEDAQVHLPGDAVQAVLPKPITVRQESFAGTTDGPRRDAAQFFVRPGYSLKRVTGKETYPSAASPIALPGRLHEPSLTLYPVLPYGFTLYFSDRQVAHVELVFKIVSAGLRNSIIVKRKISSGNLEADMVSMRYVSHYLFMQQEKIAPDVWHTVKIDLSAKER